MLRQQVFLGAAAMYPRALSYALLGSLLIAGCASTHHVLLAPPRPAISPELVKVYQVPPKRYEEIARLDASSAAGFGTQGQANAAIDRLAREAAKLGANGVLLLGVETTRSPLSMGVGGGSYGRHGGASVGIGIPTAQRRAEGIAIHVIEE